MKPLNREWNAVSDDAQLRALDIAVICASAMFWSWFALTMLFPTLYFATEFPSSVSACQNVSLGVGALVFALGAIRPAKTTVLLDSRKWETIADVVAVIGGGLAILGSHFDVHFFQVAGAVLIGVSFPYFALEWARMYSRRGARTAAPHISGALALSIAIDVAAFTFQPMARAIWVALMPALIVAVLYLIQALLRQPDSPKPTMSLLASDRAVGATELFIEEDDGFTGSAPLQTRERFTLLGCPTVLFVAALLYGIAFGVYRNLHAFGGDYTLLAALSFIGTASIFAMASLAPRHFDSLTNAYQVAGIVGIVFVAVAEYEPSDAGMLANVMVIVGILSFFVALWALVSYFATRHERQVIPAFSLNLLVLDIGFVAGSTACALLPGDAGDSVWRMLVVVLIVSAAYFLSMANSLPLNIFEIADAAANEEPGKSTVTNHLSGIARQIKESHGLTERETEILELLISGRSRPRIAEALFVSENTVNSHIQHIYRKLDIHSFQELLDFVYHTST